MNESIPCKHCGLYYTHRTNCLYWETSSSNLIYYLEADRQYKGHVYHLEKQIQELKERENMLIKALEFYANHKNWRDIVEEEGYGDNCGLQAGCFDAIIYEDCEDDVGGKLARQTLAKLKEQSSSKQGE